MKIPHRLRPPGCLGLIHLAFLLTLQTTHAGSATWNLNPPSGKWSNPANWTPGTVPNGPSDAATLDVSNKTSITLNANTEVSSIVFNPGASAFTITTKSDIEGFVDLTISGPGVTNNSGGIQNFVADVNKFSFGRIDFTNSATAGSNTLFTVNTNPFPGAQGTLVLFFDSSNAGTSTFIVGGFNAGQTGAGMVQFNDGSSAGSATFNNMGAIGFLGSSTVADATFMSSGFINFSGSSTAGNGVFSQTGGNMTIEESSSAGNGTFIFTPNEVSGFEGGVIFFGGDATADGATFTIEGGAVSGAGGDSLQFDTNATAANGNVTINGGTTDGAGGGSAFFFGTTRADNATLTINGGMASGAAGATLLFSSFNPGNTNCTAANATLIANGGVNGGSGGAIQFQGNSTGGTPRVKIFGNANLDISDRDTVSKVTIGSLEGDGLVFLGDNHLRVGSNNLDTTFSGVIQDGGGIGGGTNGSLSKVGTGTLTLNGSNTYTGGTTINAGTLVVSNMSGSATGAGTAQVIGGTLGGSGTVSGAVTVGTGSGAGAFLAPAHGTPRQATLTTHGALTMNADATYLYTFKANGRRSKTDQVIANGVTINSGAIFSVQGITQGTLRTGLILSAISNTSANPIAGTFSNLPDGAIVMINGNNFQASYEGGDGNDLTLTVVS